MQHIYGNTFPVRQHMKKLGGVWNKLRRCWDVADDRADRSQAHRSGRAHGGSALYATAGYERSGHGRRRDCSRSGAGEACVYASSTLQPMWMARPNPPTLAYDADGRPESLCCRCLPAENLHFSPGVSQ